MLSILGDPDAEGETRRRGPSVEKRSKGRTEVTDGEGDDGDDDDGSQKKEKREKEGRERVDQVVRSTGLHRLEYACAMCEKRRIWMAASRGILSLSVFPPVPLPSPVRNATAHTPTAPLYGRGMQLLRLGTRLWRLPAVLCNPEEARASGSAYKR